MPLEITSKSEEGNVKEEVFISRDGKDLVIAEIRTGRQRLYACHCCPHQ